MLYIILSYLKVAKCRYIFTTKTKEKKEEKELCDVSQL